MFWLKYINNLKCIYGIWPDNDDLNMASTRRLHTVKSKQVKMNLNNEIKTFIFELVMLECLLIPIDLCKMLLPRQFLLEFITLALTVSIPIAYVVSTTVTSRPFRVWV